MSTSSDVLMVPSSTSASRLTGNAMERKTVVTMRMKVTAMRQEVDTIVFNIALRFCKLGNLLM